jgi:arylsulfatase A-like enzyme
MITNIDENFGMLRDKLKELGLTQNTIVLFMTDNGTASGVDLDSAGYPIEGRGSYNAGMRGKKGSPYEGGHRVPFMVRYPDAGIKGGRDIDPLTGYIDFMPTLLELCGIPKPSRISFHGRSLVPLMREGPGGMWEERVIFKTERSSTTCILILANGPTLPINILKWFMSSGQNTRSGGTSSRSNTTGTSQSLSARMKSP